MSPEEILERNLEQLFSRAYAPVRAPASFRARLARELSQRIAGREVSRPRLAWRAAAAVLVGLGIAFAAWRLTRAPAGAIDVERFLAAGSAAVREGPAETWRGLSEEEARSGIRYAGPSLELATPGEVQAAVQLGSAGRIDAGSGTRLLVEGSIREDDLTLSLARGSVSVERHAEGQTREGQAWRLSTAEGSVQLADGVLELACLDLHGSPAARALLHSGTASVAAETLVPGTEVWLQDGALVATAALDASETASAQRTDAGSPAAPEASVPDSSPPNTCSLRGTLVLPAGAKAPESYLVTLLRRERLPEVSSARPYPRKDAAFEIDGLKPGSYLVFVEVEGYAVWQRSAIDLVAGAPPIALEIKLETGASVRGRVLDADGRPVEGASVFSETDVPAQLLPFTLAPLPAKWNALATTQPDGTFELGHLSRALHRLRASHPGHGATWSDVIDLASKPSGEGAADLTLRLVRPGALEGTVAQDDGTPWPNAIVVASCMDSGGANPERACLNYSSAVADLQGHYAIEDLPPGQFVVLNVLEGRQPGAGQVPRVQMVRVESGVRTRVDLPGSVLGTALAGTLLSSDGTPFGDLDVTLVPKLPGGTEGMDWKSTRSRADGRFDFPSLRPGTYAIYVGGELGAELALQEILEVPAVPTFAHTVRVGGGVLRGRVLDARTGEGLASCAVVVQTESPEAEIFAGRCVTDAQGRYVLPRLPAGKYRATAYASVTRHGQETSEGVSIGEGAGETALDFRLGPGASLLVKVVDADGRPLTGVRLRFQEEHGTSFSFSPEDRTDGSGQLHIRGLKPGRWTVRAGEEGPGNASTAVDLVADEESTVEITLSSPR